MLDDRLMRAMLGESRSIAIIGAKDKPGQAVDRVGRYLLEQGYRVVPVHPVRKTVWGLPALPSIAELPEPVDMRKKYCSLAGGPNSFGCSLAYARPKRVRPWPKPA